MEGTVFRFELVQLTSDARQVRARQFIDDGDAMWRRLKPRLPGLMRECARRGDSFIDLKLSTHGRIGFLGLFVARTESYDILRLRMDAWARDMGIGYSDSWLEIDKANSPRGVVRLSW